MLSALIVATSLAFGSTILDLSLQIEDGARQSLRRAPDVDVAATMTYRSNGEDRKYAVTVHVKGQFGSSRPVDDKPAFKIKLAKGEQFFELEHLTLNNMVQDPTMLHEALGYAVYASMGVTVPNTGYVRLTVDGQDYGLYLNVETVDPLFLERRFGNHAGILYEGAYGVDLRDGDETKFQLHEGHDPGHARLTALIRAVQAPGDAVFYGATAQVDTSSFLSMMAAGALLADWDNYYASNNYRIYWNPPAQRWVFIPTGIDQTFSGDTTPFGAVGVLFQKCLGSDRCTNDYASALRDAALRFEQLGLSTKMDALLSVIGPASQSDPKRLYDDVVMRIARESMRRFIETQPTRVRGELSCLGASGSPSVIDCAGAVAINVGFDGCLEASAKVSRCLGGPKQRWHLVVKGDAFELVAASNGNCLDVWSANPGDAAHLHHATCSGADSQLFSMRSGSHETQLVSKSSRLCLAVAPGSSKTPAVVQQPCAADSTQQWRLQRSLFK